MKIGASTLAILNKEFEGNLGFYEDLGIEYVELLHQHPNTGENRELLESFNLKYSIHTSLFDLNIASFNGNINVSATELRMMPLPAIETIREIGKKIILRNNYSIDYINDLVMEYFK